MRCLDAATGKLLWDAPFSGSPSWNRQAPPIVHGNLAIYSFSTGRYEPDRWLVGHGAIPGFPADQKPLIRAWNIETGDVAWTTDLSTYGTGGDDGGLCLMDGKLYYSCFFGFLRRDSRPDAPPRATGVTASIDPQSGRVLWATTEHAVHSGCTISGADGRLYLGGYSRVDAKTNRVWCLDARDGSLVWQSDPIDRAIHVITIARDFLFTHAQYENGYLIDKRTGKVLRTLTKDYKCTRFTLAGDCLLGANMDVWDLSSAPNGSFDLLSTGPALDPSQCVGAVVSNGRMFYTSHGSGLQASMLYGDEARSAESPWGHAAARLPVIFDTDMDTDCDDAGALAMLHALADRGEVRILATVVSSKYPQSPACVEAINRYFGRPALPIGAPKGNGASISRGSRYAKAIALEYAPDSVSKDVPDAAVVYRRVLAAQRDRSVAIVTVGYVTNLRDLLATGPDDISPLTGAELVARKVSSWTCMGGRYPAGKSRRVNGNFKPDPKSAVAATRDWPGPIYFSGDGSAIQTGKLLRSETPTDNPVRRAYDLYLRSRPTRPSWDQVALLYAVRPEAPYWQVTTAGRNHIFPDGTNEWRSEPDDPRHRLIAIAPADRDTVREIIDRLMAHVPTARDKTD